MQVFDLAKEIAEELGLEVSQGLSATEMEPVVIKYPNIDFGWRAIYIRGSELFVGRRVIDLVDPESLEELRSCFRRMRDGLF